MIEEDFKEDELITIKLPRKEYEMLKVMIKREEASQWFVNYLKSSWVWVIGGGVLTLILLWDRIHLGVK